MWPIFLALDAARGSNGFGPVPLSYAEIAAYMAVMQEPLLPWEVECVVRADRARMAVFSDRMERMKEARKTDGR